MINNILPSQHKAISTIINLACLFLLAITLFLVNANGSSLCFFIHNDTGENISLIHVFIAKKDGALIASTSAEQAEQNREQKKINLSRNGFVHFVAAETNSLSSSIQDQDNQCYSNDFTIHNPSAKISQKLRKPKVIIEKQINNQNKINVKIASEKKIIECVEWDGSSSLFIAIHILKTKITAAEVSEEAINELTSQATFITVEPPSYPEALELINSECETPPCYNDLFIETGNLRFYKQPFFVEKGGQFLENDTLNPGPARRADETRKKLFLAVGTNILCAMGVAVFFAYGYFPDITAKNPNTTDPTQNTSIGY